MSVAADSGAAGGARAAGSQLKRRMSVGINPSVLNPLCAGVRGVSRWCLLHVRPGRRSGTKGSSRELRFRNRWVLGPPKQLPAAARGLVWDYDHV